VARTAPFFGASLLLGLITIYFQYHRSISEVQVRTDSLAARFATAGCAVWFYLGKAIVPVDLMFNYPRWDVMAYGAAAFLPAVILIGVLVWLAFAWRPAFVALAGYVLLLLPMLGFLNIFYMRYSLVSDHYQYHAVPFVLAFAAGAVATLYRRVGRVMKRAIGFGTCIAVVVFTVESVGVASVYRTAESVWLDTLSRNPRSWLAHAQLGEMYLKDPAEKKLFSQATSHLLAVTELHPEMAVGYVNLAAAYAATGKTGAAKEALAKALRAPVWTRLELARAHQALGSLAARSGDFATAETEYKKAEGLDPESISIHFALGATFGREGKLPQARAELQRALELDPGNLSIQEMLRDWSGPSTATAP
jgi:tetratricopeptide (TPR) repeat protein